MDYRVGGYEKWKVITAFVVLIVIGAGLVVGSFLYMDGKADSKLRQEQAANAMRDLNNRLSTQEIGGQFTEVFFVGKEMRTRWQSDNGQKRCVMRVAPPTDDVLRYSTLDVPDDTAGFRQLTHPDTVGCLTSGGAGGIGGG
jgi:hypothetical protein